MAATLPDRPLRLATRGSALARLQAERVAAALRQRTGAVVELVLVRTAGDRRQDVALGDAGAIGLFTSEVQERVRTGGADLAVHSLKDLPARQAEGLVCAAVLEREDPRDLLLVRPEACAPGREPLALRPGARVGTASARRRAFLRALAPDCVVRLLRGNVPTRLEKLRRGELDAIVVAAAGVRRLGVALDGLHCLELDLELWPCAPGQGALAVECAASAPAVLGVARALHDGEVAAQVEPERALLRALGGGCGLPLGAFCSRRDGGFGLVAALGPTADRPGAPPLARARVSGADPASMVAAARAALLAVEVAR